MDALSTNSPVSSGISMLKQATKVQEEMATNIMESLPKPTELATPPVSGLASEGIGQNLDLRG